MKANIYLIIVKLEIEEMFCCIRNCLNGNIHKTNTTVSKLREPAIHLDAAHMGEINTNTSAVEGFAIEMRFILLCLRYGCYFAFKFFAHNWSWWLFGHCTFGTIKILF